MTWVERRWRNPRWLRRTAIFECGIAVVALVLLLVFAATGRNTTSLVVTACVVVLASNLAAIFVVRARALDRTERARRSPSSGAQDLRFRSEHNGLPECGNVP